MRDVMMLIPAVYLELTTISGAYLGLLWLNWIPSPFPGKPGRHRAGWRRPTWTKSPDYHALALSSMPAPIVRERPGQGAARYFSLARSERYARAAHAPGRVLTMVRSAAPGDEL